MASPSGARSEQALEPEIEITDPHHHLAVQGRDSSAAVGSQVMERIRDYDLAQFQADTTSGHRVTRTVYVEANSAFQASPLDEVRLASEVARRTALEKGPTISGIIGKVDLREDSAAEILDETVQASNGRLVAIRQTAVWDASPDVPSQGIEGLLTQRRFQAGFAELAQRGLAFDAFVYHPQLAEVAVLADAFPDVSIVLNHFGMPLRQGPYLGRREEVLRIWRRSLTDLAKRPNVFVKVGGIGLPSMAEPVDTSGDPRVPPVSQQLADQWGRDVRWCVELFGADRCMFESNYPADGLTCSYAELWNAFKRMVATASADEKVLLFAGTANKVYNLA